MQVFVIPAQAGIQLFDLDTCFRRYDIIVLSVAATGTN
jgi:hypothetical protein